MVWRNETPQTDSGNADWTGYSTSEIVELLRAEQGTMSTTAFAAQIGVSRQHLYDVYSSHRDPNTGILNYLGAQRETIILLPPKRWR